MKIRKILITTLMMTVSAVLLCSCMPKSYTKEQMEKKTEELVPIAEEWFQSNRPDATVKSAKVYSDGIDLMNAVSGVYTVGKNEYNFIFNVPDKQMYLEEGYREAVELIVDAIADGLNTDKKYLKAYFFDMRFDSTFAVEPEYPSDASVSYSNMIPAEYTPEKFAEEILSGERKLSFTVDVIDGIMHENARVLMDSIPNMINLTLDFKMDWEYEGINEISYSTMDTEYHYTVIKKLNDDFYGGYIYMIKTEIDEEIPNIPDMPAPVLEEKGNNEIVLKVPDETTPLIFTAKKMKPILHYSLNEKELENPLNYCDKNISSSYYGKNNWVEGYDYIMGSWIGGFVLPKSNMNCYYAYFTPSHYFEEYDITY